MKIIYVLHHIYNIDEDCEDLKIIGIYSSLDAAEQAVNRLKDKPGFREFPNVRDVDQIEESGFEISEALIDRDGWVEGFATWTNGDWVD